MTQRRGFAQGVTFEFIGLPILTRHGGASFYARLNGPGISDDAFNAGNDDTLWVVASGGLPEIILQSGVPVSAARTPEEDQQCTEEKDEEEDQADDEEDEDDDDFRAGNVAGLSAHQQQFGTKVDLYDVAAPVCGGGGQVPPAASAFFVGTTTATSIAAATGLNAPGTTSELLTIESIGLSVAADPDFVFFSGAIAAGDGLWLGPLDAIEPLVLPNAPLPASLVADFGASATFGNEILGRVANNDSGEIAFIGAARVPAESDRAVIFAGAPIALRAVATAVTSQAEEGFTSFDTVVLNAGGDVAFTAGDTSLDGFPGQYRALWMTHDKGEPFSPLAEGRTAAGLAIGEVVSFLEEGPYMNAAGQVLMRTGVGSAAGFENTVADVFWLVDPVTGPELIVREGESIELDGETRDVSSIGLLTAHAINRSGGSDARPSPLSDDGSFVFYASLATSGGGFESAVLVAGEATLLSCGDATGDSSVSASDALAVLLAAVGLDSCELCVCDVDQSGGVAATDALRTLQAAVGLPGVTLDCPSC